MNDIPDGATEISIDMLLREIGALHVQIGVLQQRLVSAYAEVSKQDNATQKRPLSNDQTRRENDPSSVLEINGQDARSESYQTS